MDNKLMFIPNDNKQNTPFVDKYYWLKCWTLSNQDLIKVPNLLKSANEELVFKL